MQFLQNNKRLALGAGGVVLLVAAVVNVPVDDATAGLVVKIVGVVGGALVGVLAAKFGGSAAPSDGAK